MYKRQAVNILYQCVFLGPRMNERTLLRIISHVGYPWTFFLITRLLRLTVFIDRFCSPLSPISNLTTCIPSFSAVRLSLILPCWCLVPVGWYLVSSVGPSVLSVYLSSLLFLLVKVMLYVAHISFPADNAWNTLRILFDAIIFPSVHRLIRSECSE